MQCHIRLGAAIILLNLCLPIKAQELTELAKDYLPKLRSHLTEQIAPFWFQKSLDRENEGYQIHHDIEGTLEPGGTKMIVTQSRTMWLFARMARAGFDPVKNITAAELGFQFLKEKMWDTEHGGFFWEVDRTGNTIIKPNKHLYGQSFALYGLCELYLASHQQEALDLALELFALLERHAHDPDNGGYHESFNSDWTAKDAHENSYMGVPSSYKLMNTHLHLLESITCLYRAAPSATIRERLAELVTIQSNTVVRHDFGVCTDKYTSDWTPILSDGYDRVSYGHDLENIWLLMDARQALQLSQSPLDSLYKTLFASSMRYGYDNQNGGFYDSGKLEQLADRKDKVWWVQSEAIVAALYLYRLTGDEEYRKVFEQTYRWIETKQLDKQRGEWFSSIKPDGTPSGPKASIWKAGYHNGRALIECIEILNEYSN